MLLQTKETFTYLLHEAWEAIQFAAGQEIPHILWNPRVHYHIHKCLPPGSILSQLNPVHTPTLHLLKIHLNIILPSMPGSPQWALSFRFSHQTSEHASPLPHMHYLPHPSHSSWLKETFKKQICRGDEKLVLCVLCTLDSSRLGDMSFFVFPSTSKTPGHYAKLGDHCFISLPSQIITDRSYYLVPWDLQYWRCH
jgi:hypothetical protein